jgi:hypothetical protein
MADGRHFLVDDAQSQPDVDGSTDDDFERADRGGFLPTDEEVEGQQWRSSGQQAINALRSSNIDLQLRVSQLEEALPRLVLRVAPILRQHEHPRHRSPNVGTATRRALHAPRYPQTRQAFHSSAHAHQQQTRRRAIQEIYRSLVAGQYEAYGPAQEARLQRSASDDEALCVSLETLASAQRHTRALRFTQNHPEGNNLLRTTTVHQQSLTAIAELLPVVEIVLLRFGDAVFRYDTTSPAHDDWERVLDRSNPAIQAAVCHAKDLAAAMEDPEESFDRAATLNRESLKVIEALSGGLQAMVIGNDDATLVHTYPDGTRNRSPVTGSADRWGGDGEGNNRGCECAPDGADPAHCRPVMFGSETRCCFCGWLR